MSSRLPARRRWQLFIAGQDAGPTFRVKTPGIFARRLREWCHDPLCPAA